MKNFLKRGLQGRTLLSPDRPFSSHRQVAVDLAQIGICRGDRIFVHSSLKSIGPLKGGPSAVVAALQKAVGPQGTVGMPVFPYGFSPETAFDLKMSPSRTGAVTETFRQSKGVVRSYSPSHSVAFWGQDAEYLASGHAELPPYARSGPFGKMYDLNFKIVLLGCGLAPNSMLHAIEDWAGLPYMRHGVTTCYCKNDPAPAGRLYHGMPVGHREFYIPGEASLESRYAKLMRRHGKLHSGAVGQAPTHWMKARDLVDVSMSELDRQPDLFLCDKPECSSCVENKQELKAWLRAGGSRWDWVRLGRAKVCITPGVDTWSNHGMGPGELCEGVLDDLYARALVFRKGFRKWVIVTTDLLFMTREVADQIKLRISKRNQIAPEDISICCSHTHYGPAMGARHIWKKKDIRDHAYVATLSAKISGAVYEAAKECLPVTFRFEKKKVDIGGINRRVRLPDGRYAYYTGPELTPKGPAAKEFGMIFFYNPDGRLRGGLGHYSCHPIFTPAYLRKITGDYAGLFAQAVEKEMGEDCVVGFLQGAMGDQMPLHYCSRYELAREAGKTLAYEFLSASRKRGAKPLKNVAFCSELYRVKGTTQRKRITPIQGIRLGDVGLGLIGGELFYELTPLFEKAVGRNSLLVSVANDELGYLPTRDAFKHPTYEVDGCKKWMGGKAGVGEELIRVCAGLVRKARTEG